MAVVINGSTGITTPADTVPEGRLYPLVSGTAVASTSGTSIDFTSIPSWVKRITLMFKGVSTNGNSLPIAQLGDSGGFETTGYVSSGATIGPSAGSSSATTGIVLAGSNGATVIQSGAIVFTLISTNVWVASGNFCRDDIAGYISVIAGSKTLSDTLTQLRITTVNGTDAYDAGYINILYE